jgi:type IV pilus assembly protein PilW
MGGINHNRVRGLLEMKHEHGFSLIELMMAIAISGIVVGAVYGVYLVQQKSYFAQREIVAMQQSLRAAMQLIERDIRMAGYTPYEESAGGIQTANTNTIRFTMDIHDGTDNDSDGRTDEFDEIGNGDDDTNDIGEDITYFTADPDGDGLFDLFRRDNFLGADQILAYDVDALDFVYLDNNGSITSDLGKIRSVQVTMVARTGRPDRGFRDNKIYVNQKGTVILPQQNDSFRRRLLTCEVRGRNLAL